MQPGGATGFRSRGERHESVHGEGLQEGAEVEDGQPDQRDSARQGRAVTRLFPELFAYGIGTPSVKRLAVGGSAKGRARARLR